METVTEQRPAFAGRQVLVLALVFAVILALLGGAYFLFARTEYTVLSSNMRPGDASAIVSELDRLGVPYKIRDGGATILVAEEQADATRVALAGSEAVALGSVGFELFNKSDMGLTNFAQKINYQRALQGELVRTITMMDGIETARVHLALPERALFRGDRNEPKAAVTIAMKPARHLDAESIAGVQRLVAAAVPDLPVAKVVVLDQTGRVVSSSEVAAPERSADMEERAAIQQYHRARARAAVEKVLPGTGFLIRVLALPAPGDAGTDAAAALGARDFPLSIVFLTLSPLAPEDEQRARDAITSAVALDAARGDSLTFEVGPIESAPAAEALPAPRTAVTSVPDFTAAVAADAVWPAAWIWAVGCVLLAITALVFLRRRQRDEALLDDADHDAFAERLRRQLQGDGEGRDVAA
jgi:flagellar M-ring protein FliF